MISFFFIHFNIKNNVLLYHNFYLFFQLMERSNVLVTLRKKSEFSSDSIIDDLNTLIKFKKGQKQNAQSLPEVNLNVAMSATSALIKYLEVNILS